MAQTLKSAERTALLEQLRARRAALQASALESTPAEDALATAQQFVQRHPLPSIAGVLVGAALLGRRLPRSASRMLVSLGLALGRQGGLSPLLESLFAALRASGKSKSGDVAPPGAVGTSEAATPGPEPTRPAR